MKTMFKATLCVLAATISLPAFATGFHHCGGSNEPSCPTFNVGGLDETYKKAYASSDNTTYVQASAWTNSGGTLYSANAESYSGGLGVLSGAETRNTYPDHGLDNNITAGNISGDGYEWIMLSFNKAVSLDQIELGWYYNDADMTILSSTTGGTNLSAWSLVTNLYFDGSSTDDFTSNGSGGLKTKELNLSVDDCASYWLIGAINPSYASSGYVGTDYFKVLSVAACTDCTTPPPPNTGVSEPASLALAGLGLAGIVGLRRRRS